MTRSRVLAFLVSLIGTPGQAQLGANAEQELATLRIQLTEALLKKDRAFLEMSFADEFYCIHSNGVAMNKAEQIGAAMSSDRAWTATKTDELRIRVYGDLAVVTGRITYEGTAQGFTPGPRRFTDIFVHRAGRWQMIGCHATLVPPR
jgi:hypothetical protein